MEKPGVALALPAPVAICTAQQNLQLPPQAVKEGFIDATFSLYQTKFEPFAKLAQAETLINEGSASMKKICDGLEFDAKQYLSACRNNPDNHTEADQYFLNALERECKNIPVALKQHKDSHNHLCATGNDVSSMRSDISDQTVANNNVIKNFECKEEWGQQSLTSIEGTAFVLYKSFENSRSVWNIFAASSRDKTKESLQEVVLEANKKVLAFIDGAENELKNQRVTVNRLLEAAYPIETHAQLSRSYLITKRPVQEEVEKLVQACEQYKKVYNA